MRNDAFAEEPAVTKPASTTRLRRFRSRFICGAAALCVAAVAHAAVLTPAFGPADTQVEIRLAGLESNAVTGAQLANVGAPIVARGDGSVTISIPSGASSGPITLILGQESRVTPESFEVTRVIGFSVDEGFPANTEGGSLFGDASAGQVQVAVGRANLIFASNGADGPVLLDIATDGSGAVSLDGATTARAALFMSPLIYTVDSAEAATRLGILANLAEVNALAAFIEAQVTAGRDYSETAGFRQLAEAALTAYLSQPGTQAARASKQSVPKAAEAAASANGYIKRDLKTPGFEKLDRVEPKAHSATLDRRTGLPIVQQKFGSAPLPDVDLGKYLTANPLESCANLYQLSIADPRLDTRPEAEGLLGSHSDVYPRLAPEALDRLVIKSEPATRYADLVGLGKDWLGKQLMGRVNEHNHTTIKSELDVPDTKPGLYMVRSFNGSRFDRQDALIDNLPGGRIEDTKMLALNTVLAVNDAISFFISVNSALSADEWGNFLAKLYVNVSAALEAQATQGTLDRFAVAAIFQATLKTAYDFVFDTLRKAGISKLPSRLGGLVKSVVDLSSKVSKAAKFVERLNALTNGVQIFNDNVYTIQSVEDTLLIVGDPWKPELSGFYPQKARRGDRVTITGARFSSNPDENIVTIGYLGTSPSEPPIPVRAPVIRADANSLLIFVPEEANSGVITVHVAGKGTASTATLEPPFQQFEVIPDPVLLSVDPGTAEAGQRMRLIGQHFPPLENDPLKNKLTAVFTFGSESTQVPLAGSSTELIVTAPFNAGSGTVRLKYGEQFGGPAPRFSNAINFSVIAAANPPDGAEIRFVASPDSNGHEKDDRLTLREALMLKNGSLSYSALSTPPSPRPPNTTYETDFLSSNVVGNAVRNRIIARLPSGTFTLSLNSSLPPVASWTTLEIGRSSAIGSAPVFVIQGNGVATGIVLDNARNTTVFGLNLKNFSSAAFLLTGGSSDNHIDLCSVEGGAGHGVQFLGSARRNLIGGTTIGASVPVKGVGGNGYHFSGADVFDNEIVIGKKPANQNGFIEGCGGWGVAIENGARLNRVRAPRDLIFVAPPSAAILSNQAGGILVTGAESTGNIIEAGSRSAGSLRVHNNAGPGIRIASPQTTVYQNRITGNNGSGIEIIGAAATGSRVGSSTIGYLWETGAPEPNKAHGILVSGASGIQLGDDVIDPFQAVPMNSIGANNGNGILIENSRDITVRSTEIGRVRLSAQNLTFVDLPNDLSGVVVQNSSDCTFGSSWYVGRLQVTGHLNGTGLRLGGATTTNNTVIGSFIGYDSFDQDTDLGNNIGVEIVEGAWGNRIGLAGRGVNPTGASPMNYIFYNRVAGLLIDSGTDPSQSVPGGGEPFAPRGANVIVNNSIAQQHDTGVLLGSNSRATQIGGTNSEFNIINSNGKVGVKIDSVVTQRAELGNRVIGNTIFGNGLALPAADPVAGVAEGVGVLVLNSTRQRIGGDHSAEGNRIRNGWGGVVVLGGSSNFVGHNTIGNLRKAGVILRDTQSNQVGPANEITDCGLPNFGPVGGLVISGGSLNNVLGNRIGSFRNGTARSIAGDGIVLRETSSNVIGGHASDGNIINNASGYGLRISGGTSMFNTVAGNDIGRNPGASVLFQPNNSGGIVIDGGAQGNRIGGALPVLVNGAIAQMAAGNFIRHNVGEGVRVAGVPSVSNSITNNSISGNTGQGIFLASGNNNIEAPQLAAEAGRINGTSNTPNGSLVQFFWDTGDEGIAFVGETQVIGGTFQIAIPPLLSHTEMTATVTSSVTGDTSQFAVPVTVIPPRGLLLRVSRTGSDPVQRAAAPGAHLNVLPMQLDVAGDEAVRVTRLAFDFTGTEPAAVAEAALYLDENRNGFIDSADPQVGSTLTDLSTGAVFLGSLIVVEPNAPAQLLLTLKLASNAADGHQVEFRLPSAAGVAAAAVIGPTPVTVVGVFPVITDRVAVDQNAPIDSDGDGMSDAFELQYGLNPNDPSDAVGDPDSDGEDNLAEFRTGTDPNDPNSVTRTGRTLNISTRLRVLTGDNALIGGYIVTGSEPKTVVMRGLGPSLGAAGVPDTLADPVLELFDSAGNSIAFNNDWRESQQAEIEATSIPPSDDRESAIVRTLDPGAYTAVLSGVGEGTGVSLVEIYDLSGPPARLANISTRGFVDTGDNVMIGGFIVGGGIGANGAGSARFIARALGPSLAAAGVPNPLQDPTLEVYNGSGDLIAANNNWRDTQQAEIEATGIPPGNDLEATVVASVPAGPYTAIVRGANDGTGVGLIEVYNLNP